jgi:hypothetical protein
LGPSGRDLATMMSLITPAPLSRNDNAGLEILLDCTTY